MNSGYRPYWVVFVGRNPGIHNSRAQTKLQTKDFPGGISQKFQTYSAAKSAWDLYQPTKPVPNGRTYVVWCGHKPGVYDNLEDAQRQTGKVREGYFKAYQSSEKAHLVWNSRKHNLRSDLSSLPTKQKKPNGIVPAKRKSSTCQSDSVLKAEPDSDSERRSILGTSRSTMQHYSILESLYPERRPMLEKSRLTIQRDSILESRLSTNSDTSDERNNKAVAKGFATSRSNKLYLPLTEARFPDSTTPRKRIKLELEENESSNSIEPASSLLQQEGHDTSADKSHIVHNMARILESSGTSLTMKHPGETSKQNNSLYSGPIMHVYVGSHGQEFAIHQQLICSRSDFFAHELEQHGTIRLPTIAPAVFAMFSHWLYSGSIFEEMRPLTQAFMLDWNQKQLELAGLWILAERVSVPALQNAALRALSHTFSAMKKDTNPKCVLYVLRNTRRVNPLRRWIINQIAWLFDTGAVKIPDIQPLHKAEIWSWLQMLADIKSHPVPEQMVDAALSIEEFLIPVVPNGPKP